MLKNGDYVMAFAVLRLLRETDVDDVALWMAEVPLWKRYGVTAASAAAQFKRGIADGAHILVAEQDKFVRGFAWVVRRGAFDRSGYLKLLGIHPAAQGSGLGAQLLAAAEAHVRTEAREMILLCSDFNTDAQHFYERHGYRKVGELPDYVVKGITEFIYEKKL